jgi:hypothetical protein
MKAFPTERYSESAVIHKIKLYTVVFLDFKIFIAGFAADKPEISVLVGFLMFIGLALTGSLSSSVQNIQILAFSESSLIFLIASWLVRFSVDIIFCFDVIINCDYPLTISPPFGCKTCPGNETGVVTGQKKEAWCDFIRHPCTFHWRITSKL